MTYKFRRYPDKPIRIGQDHLERMTKEGVWLSSAKMDGWRAKLVHTKDGEFQAWSRHGKRLDTLSDFDPQIIEAFKRLDTPPDSRIDTEWLGRRAGNAEKVSKCGLIGVLKWGGDWLSSEKESKRWERTLELGSRVDGQFLYLPEWSDGDFVEFFQRCQNDPLNEGVVLKHVDSTLVLSIKESVKNQGWYKVKWRDGADGQSPTNW